MLFAVEADSLGYRCRAGRRYQLAALCAVAVSLILGGCQGPGAAGPVTSARLSALQVSGGERMYPAFDPGVLHYAVRCADGAALQVAAEAEAEDTTLRLLHDGSTATGTVQRSVTVNGDHDIAIEVSNGLGTATYVVHCIPPDFPDIIIETHTEAVSDGLLLMTPGVRRSDPPISFLAIVDNNGVPRWVMRPNVNARNFRRYPDGRFSFAERSADGTEPTVILDAGFNRRIDTATLVGDLLPEHTGGHDFLIMENGNYLVMSYYPNQRDFSDFECAGAPCSVVEGEDTDSIIQEVTPDGEQVLHWNSWDHVKIEDCRVHRFPDDYAHLNSLHELEGDIVAGLRGCAQVLRLERDTGAVVWQMGGTPTMRADRPMPSSGATQYLPVVGDAAARNEFCGQHHVTATPAGSVLMFDNGNHCLGPRKNDPQFTRIVEYDISSGTEARFVREYRLPEADGFAASGGGVTELENGNWLITWGNNGPNIAVSEVDPAGNEIFRVRMSKDGEQYGTGRVYREPEADLAIPLNLP